MEKNVHIALLLDFYSSFLTEKQRNVMDLYYNNDLSLGEIAEHEKISRQGVHDAIKRGEALLYDMEERLGLLKQNEEITRSLKKCLCELNGVKVLPDSVENLERSRRELFKIIERLGG